MNGPFGGIPIRPTAAVAFDRELYEVAAIRAKLENTTVRQIVERALTKELGLNKPIPIPVPYEITILKESDEPK